MTAEPLLSPSNPQLGADARQREAERVVETIRESWRKIEPHAEEMTQYFYGVLFTTAPETRAMFPANMETQRSRLLRALVHFVQLVDRPDELVPYLRQLGRDHRKFDVIAEHFDVLGTALLAALKRFAGEDWNPAVERAWADGYASMARAMKEGAAADEWPAWWQATVVGYDQVDWDTAIIRVQPSEPVPYTSGQFVSVETPQRKRLWRYLSPANAPRGDNTIDFHVRAVADGWVSRAITRHTHVGDVWKIGAPLGNLWADPDADRDLLLIGGGTGIAPLRAVLEELIGRSEHPDVSLYFGGRTAEELYHLDELRALATDHPWLSVTAVTEDGSITDGITGTLADAVTARGAWPEHDVLLAGSPEMIRSTVSAMLVAGTTADQISYDSFVID